MGPLSLVRSPSDPNNEVTQPHCADMRTTPWTDMGGTYPAGLETGGWSVLSGGSVPGMDLLVAQTGLVVRRD